MCSFLKKETHIIDSIYSLNMVGAKYRMILVKSLRHHQRGSRARLWLPAETTCLRPAQRQLTLSLGKNCSNTLGFGKQLEFDSLESGSNGTE